MHELMVTESILEIALRHGANSGAARITDLYLVVGEFSSVVDDSVQFYWDFISEGTAAEGARLHFKRVPAEMTCLDCQHCFSPASGLTCPECGSVKIQITAGREFFLEAIEVSEEAMGRTISDKETKTGASI